MMSPEIVFRLCGLAGTLIVVAGMVASFPSKATDLTGAQALMMIGSFIAVMAQVFAFGASK